MDARNQEFALRIEESENNFSSISQRENKDETGTDDNKNNGEYFEQCNPNTPGGKPKHSQILITEELKQGGYDSSSSSADHESEETEKSLQALNDPVSATQTQIKRYFIITSNQKPNFNFTLRISYQLHILEKIHIDQKTSYHHLNLSYRRLSLQMNHQEQVLPPHFCMKEFYVTFLTRKLKPFVITQNEDPVKQNDNVDKAKLKLDNPILNEQSLKTLFIQEYKQSDQNNPVVYNRYQSIFGNSQFQNSAYQLLKSEFNPMTQLVNVKELIANDARSLNPTSSSPIVLPYYTPYDQNDKTLVFESRFESGNLAMAFKLNENEYNLVLQNDINTKGHTQWFFFRVSNIHSGISVKFNLLNHTKPDSLFNYGMKVLVYSEQVNKNTGIGWHRDGRDIAYYQNSFKKDQVGRSRYYYTLTFTYDFQHDQDTVYFAYSYPYTYSDLTDELTNIERDQIKSQYLTRNTLCRTIAGNKCEYITITAKNHPDQKQERKGIFLSARVHPGESNSSWMMKGIIDFLVSQSPEALVLREKFVFKIIPMLNPDGVINGNYRCSLAGADLNRRWKIPMKQLHPEIFESKKLCKNFQRERQIVLYCDLHGHSRNKNVFMYGNNYPENPESTRLFPFILSKVCESFSYESCRYNLHKSKEATARITMWRELKMPAVYTMEASFCGSDIGSLAGLHYTAEHLMDIGKRLCLSLLIYCDVDVPKSLKEINAQNKKKAKKNKDQHINDSLTDQPIAEELIKYTRKALIAELMSDKLLLNSGSQKEQGEDGGGSDSDPSEDNMDEDEMAKIIPIKTNSTKKKQDAKKQLPLRKQFKQEETKEQKQQTTQQSNSPNKPKVNRLHNKGGSFFDRVRLPKSFGLRRVEMVDAWTQTSNRGSDTEQKDVNKDESVQAQDKDQESNIDISPTRGRTQFKDYTVNSQSPDRPFFNLETIRNYDSNSSQSVIITNPNNKQRMLVPSSQKKQSISPIKQPMGNLEPSPLVKDRIQAMQIINQYIKDSQMTIKSTTNSQNYFNDPYNFFINQQQQQQQMSSFDQKQFSNHILHSPEKAKITVANNQFQIQTQPVQILPPSQLSQQNTSQQPVSNQIHHKRKGSNNGNQQQNEQNYYLDQSASNPTQLGNIIRGISEQQPAIINKPLEFNNTNINMNTASSHQTYSIQPPSSIQPQQSNRINPQQNFIIQQQNSRSLSGNQYIRSKKQTTLLNQNKSNEEYNIKQQTNLSNQQQQYFNQSQQKQNTQQSNFNTSGIISQGNSRATTLPQLNNNDSLQQRSQGNTGIKQNKSQSFYEGLKAQQSFKSTNNNIGGGLSAQKNEYLISEEQMLNSSFIKSNASPLPFENLAQYNFKRKHATNKKGSNKSLLPQSNFTEGAKRGGQQFENGIPQARIEEFTPQSTHNKEQMMGFTKKLKMATESDIKKNSINIIKKRKPSEAGTSQKASALQSNTGSSFIHPQYSTNSNTGNLFLVNNQSHGSHSTGKKQPKAAYRKNKL